MSDTDINNQEIEQLTQKDLQLYPKYDDPDFNEKIQKHLEFSVYYQQDPLEKDKSLNIEQKIEKACQKEKGFRLKPHQKMLSNFISDQTPYDSLLVYHLVGTGKSLKKGTKVLMFDGKLRNVEDIQIGEQVMGDDSTPRNVVDLGKGREEMFDIIPTKGEKYTVNRGHVLCLQYSGSPIIKYDPRQNPKKRKPYVYYFDNKKVNMTTKTFENEQTAQEFIKQYKSKKENYIFTISVEDYLKRGKKSRQNYKGYRVGVNFKSKEVDFDPYILGVWLGDGTSSNTQITTQSHNIIKYMYENLKKYDLQFVHDQGASGYHYSIRPIQQRKDNLFKKSLKDYNILNNKRIPYEYLTSDREVRLRVFAGLMDTDGCYDKKGKGFEIIQKRKSLTDDILFLARSLGYAAYTKKCNKSCVWEGKKFTGEYYRTYISGNNLEEVPTLIPRKRAEKRLQIKDPLITGIKVKSVGIGDYYGLRLDGNHKYVLGDFTVTHNTCTAIQIAHQFVEKHQQKIYVFAENQKVKENFQSQLFDFRNVRTQKHGKLYPNQTFQQCIGNYYFDKIQQPKKLNEETFKRKINSLIGADYVFVTYSKFVNDVQREMQQRGKDAVIEHYGNSIFIMDEAHNLRQQKTRQKFKTSSLLNLLKHMINTKIILLTATPIFNSADEVLDIINLLNIQKEQKIYSKSDFFDSENNLINKDKLVNLLRGKVSYVKGQNPFEFPIRLYPDSKNLVKSFPTKSIYGSKIPSRDMLKDMPIMKTTPSKIQLEVINQINQKKFLSDQKFNINDDENVNRKKLRQFQEINNLVYSDSINIQGRRGFDHVFVRQGSTRPGQSVLKYKDLHNRILSPSLINDYAPKFKTMIDQIKNSEGVVFIYSYFLPCGVLPIAVCLEHLGARPYQRQNILDQSCIQQNEKDTNFNFQYVIMTNNDNPYNMYNQGVVDKIKSDENKNGEIIKVILATSTSSEGIEFKNIRQIHIMDPWFNINKIEQVIGRGIRNCSHGALEPKKRNTTIFLHGLHSDKQETLDMYTYRIAYLKQKQIVTILNIMIENSIDAVFNLINYQQYYMDIIDSHNQVRKNYPLVNNDFNDIVGSKITISKKQSEYVKPSVLVNYYLFAQKFLKDYDDVVIEYFQTKKTIKATYSEIQFYVKQKFNQMGINYSEFSLLEYLTQMVNNKRTFIINQSPVYLIYRSDSYIIHPSGLSQETFLSSIQRHNYIKQEQQQYRLTFSSFLTDQIENFPFSWFEQRNERDLNIMEQDYNRILIIFKEQTLKFYEEPEIVMAIQEYLLDRFDKDLMTLKQEIYYSRHILLEQQKVCRIKLVSSQLNHQYKEITRRKLIDKYGDKITNLGFIYKDSINNIIVSDEIACDGQTARGDAFVDVQFNCTTVNPSENRPIVAKVIKFNNRGIELKPNLNMEKYPFAVVNPVTIMIDIEDTTFTQTQKFDPEQGQIYQQKIASWMENIYEGQFCNVIIKRKIIYQDNLDKQDKYLCVAILQDFVQENSKKNNQKTKTTQKEIFPKIPQNISEENDDSDEDTNVVNPSNYKRQQQKDDDKDSLKSDDTNIQEQTIQNDVATDIQSVYNDKKTIENDDEDNNTQSENESNQDQQESDVLTDDEEQLDDEEEEEEDILDEIGENDNMLEEIDDTPENDNVENNED